MCSANILQRYYALKFRPRNWSRQACAAWFPLFHSGPSSRLTHDVPQTFSEAQRQPLQPSTQLAKLRRPPFLKDLFLGKFNTDMLTYPEALDKTQLEILDRRVESLCSHFKNHEIKDMEHSMHAIDLTYLKRSGLLGVQVPVEYGGLNLLATEYVRIHEIMSVSPYLTLTSLTHGALGVKGVLLHGSEEQKSRYLSKLANGEQLASFCYMEETGGRDASLVSTVAKLSEDEASYTVNGKKAFVPNGETADLYFALVKLCHQENVDDRFEVPKYFPSVLIIPRDAVGITCHPCSQVKGLQELNMCTVQFENTPVPKENVLGDVGLGFQVSSDILGSSRLGFGAITAGILRHLLDKTVNHAINTVQYSKPLMEFEMIQEKISRISCGIYAMESVSYLTAGIVDGSIQPDYLVEGLAETIFSIDTGLQCIEECYDILDSRIEIDGMTYDQYLRHLAHLCSLEGSTDILRVYLGVVGESHVGKEKADEIRKLRNSVMFPHFTMKKRLREEWRMLTGAKSNLDLAGFVHPSLCKLAQRLEECLEFLEYSAELLLRHHGKHVTERQMDLKRVANIAIHAYVMTAVLGRASRSYCIGLQNAETELFMAECIILASSNLIRKWAEEIREGPYVSLDENRKKIASSMFEFKGYAAEHPLTRNW